MATLVEEEMHVHHAHPSEQDMMQEVVHQSPAQDMNEHTIEMSHDQQALQGEELGDVQHMYQEQGGHEMGVPEAVEGEEEVIDDGQMIHEHEGLNPEDHMHHVVPEAVEHHDGEPPIPEPVHHEEVNFIKDPNEIKHSPETAPVQTPPTPNMSGPHLSPAPPQPMPPKLTAQEISLITEAASKPGPNGTFQCTLCNKQFGYKNGLIRHIRLTHVGEKPYECNICHRRFGYKHILMEHQNLHYGHRPYACSQCDKRFAARSNLIQHRMVHKRPFNCGLCNKRFDKEDQLKKHLYAHPQALLNCTLCKFAAATQNDLNKHIMDEHAAAIQEGLRRNGEGLSPLQLPVREPFQRHTEPITPPGTVASPEDLSQVQQAVTSAALRALERGHRIESICSQLSSNAANHSPTDERFQGVLIKKENSLDPDGAVRVQSVEAPYQVGNVVYSSSGELFRVSAQNSLNSLAPSQVGSPSSLNNNLQDEGNRAAEELHKQSALPGIHEMFRRTPNHLGVPFTNFPGGINPHALALASDSRMQGIDIPNLLMSPPPTSLNQGHSVAPLLVSNQRPPSSQVSSANLPPGSKKDQAVQHTAPIAGYPSLEDILSYYISQGKLFKCQFCDVLFFERGMYFLHASLHGNSGPWECSICHKICSDKNEFTIHFVNQQHPN